MANKIRYHLYLEIEAVVVDGDTEAEVDIAEWEFEPLDKIGSMLDRESALELAERIVDLFGSHWGIEYDAADLVAIEKKILEDFDEA